MTDAKTRQFYETHAAALAAETEHLLHEPSATLHRAFPAPCKFHERIGFDLQWREDTPDRLNRPGIHLATLCFDLPAEGAERPLHQVESILNP